MPSFGTGLNNESISPATVGVEVTKHDTNVVRAGGRYPRAFMVDADGTLIVVMSDNATSVPQTLTVKAGTLYPLSVKIFKTGGTATGIHAFG